MLLIDDYSENDFLQFAPDLSSIRSGTFYIPKQGGRSVIQSGIIRILDKNHHPVGAGILVNPDTAITCAHVVSLALEIKVFSEKPEKNISIDFPFLTPGIVSSAEVIVWEVLDDIAVLQLIGDLPPGKQALELVGDVDVSGHSFLTIGFPDIHHLDFGLTEKSSEWFLVDYCN